MQSPSWTERDLEPDHHDEYRDPCEHVTTEEFTDAQLGYQPYTRPVNEWQIRRRKKGEKRLASMYDVYMGVKDNSSMYLNTHQRKDQMYIQCFHDLQKQPDKFLAQTGMDCSNLFLDWFCQRPGIVPVACDQCEKSGRSSHVLVDERQQMLFVCDERINCKRTSKSHTTGIRTQRNFTSPIKVREAEFMTILVCFLKPHPALKSPRDEKLGISGLTQFIPKASEMSLEMLLPREYRHASIGLMFRCDFGRSVKIASLMLVPRDDIDATTLLLAVDESKSGKFGLYKVQIPEIDYEAIDQIWEFISKTGCTIAEAKRRLYVCEPPLRPLTLCPVDVSFSCVWPGTEWAYSLRQDYVNEKTKQLVPNTDAWVWWHNGRVLATVLHKGNGIGAPFMIAIMRFKYELEGSEAWPVLVPKLVKFDTVLIDQSSVPRPLVNDADWPPCLIGHNGRWLIFNVVPGQQKYAALKCLWQQKEQHKFDVNEWQFDSYKNCICRDANVQQHHIAQLWMTSGGHVCIREVQKPDKHSRSRHHIGRYLL